jgi:DNA-binding MarR family transcriptional regulator
MQILRGNVLGMSDEIPAAHLDAWRAMLNAHAALIGEVERRLASAGLPPLSWYDVLWALKRSSGRSLRMLELARAVVTISPSGLTRLVDRIEAAGLLERRPCATDRRGYEAVLTTDGAAMLRRMWPVYAGVLSDHLVPNLSDRQALTVATALGRVPDSARRAVTPAGG